MGFMTDNLLGGDSGYCVGYGFPFFGWGMMIGWIVIALELRAMDILKERYVKGEITSDQFQKMSEELKK